MPTQVKMSLLKYFNAWQETLLIDMVMSTVYSVVNGSHPSMHRVGERVLINMEG